MEHMIHRSAHPENQDIEKLLLAAEHGEAEAQYHLGNVYYLGEGTPQDYAEAAKWYRLAAEQGDASAQNNLGVMYELGEGVPKDYVKAYAWLNLSAANGKENAARGKDLLRSRMTAEQVAEGQKLAAELFGRIESSQSQ